MNSQTENQTEINTAPVMEQTDAKYLYLIYKIEDYMNDKDKPQDLRFAVMTWSAEFPERNYERMLRIKNLLSSIKEDYIHPDFDVPEDMSKEIKQIGLSIHNEGGFTAQQGCYYIMINFMNDKNDKRLKALDCVWSGVGDWAY